MRPITEKEQDSVYGAGCRGRRRRSHGSRGRNCGVRRRRGCGGGRGGKGGGGGGGGSSSGGGGKGGSSSGGGK